MKKLLSLTIAIIMMLAVSACGKSDTTSSQPQKAETYKGMDMTVACLKGPTGVGMVNLMDQNEQKKTENNYDFTIANSADEISGKIVSGEINIASVPTNLAVKLYNKTQGKIRLLSVNTLGVLSIIENGEAVSSIEDLRGKIVYSTGEGSNPEYILKYLLKENNLDPEKDLTLTFVATNDELVSALVSGKCDCAMVPEPAATTVLTKKETLRRALSVTDEWNKIAKTDLMMGCVVALDTFVEANKPQVDKFLEEYKASVDFANKNTEDCAKLCEKYEIIPSAAVAQSAIPECNVKFVTAKDAQKPLDAYYNILLSFDPTSIGGKLPEANFYYEK